MVQASVLTVINKVVLDTSKATGTMKKHNRFGTVNQKSKIKNPCPPTHFVPWPFAIPLAAGLNAQSSNITAFFLGSIQSLFFSS